MRGSWLYMNTSTVLHGILTHQAGMCGLLLPLDTVTRYPRWSQRRARARDHQQRHCSHSDYYTIHRAQNQRAIMLANHLCILGLNPTLKMAQWRCQDLNQTCRKLIILNTKVCSLKLHKTTHSILHYTFKIFRSINPNKTPK